MKSYQMTQAPESGVKVLLEGNILRIFFDFEEVTHTVGDEDDTTETTEWVAEAVEVIGSRDYGDIVAAIVKERFGDNAVQAIVANILDTLRNPLSLTAAKIAEYREEFDALRAWRQRAKEVAHIVMTLI